MICCKCLWLSYDVLMKWKLFKQSMWSTQPLKFWRNHLIAHHLWVILIPKILLNQAPYPYTFVNLQSSLFPIQNSLVYPFQSCPLYPYSSFLLSLIVSSFTSLLPLPISSSPFPSQYSKIVHLKWTFFNKTCYSLPKRHLKYLFLCKDILSSYNTITSWDGPIIY